MATAPKGGQFPENHRHENDAGATFVLQSKGEWWHAGFHLTTAIVGPTMLTLPYALRGLVRVRAWSVLLDGDGGRHIVRLLPHVQDFAFHYFTTRIDEILPLYSNSDRDYGNSISASHFPFPETHKLVFVVSQPGLHSSCGTSKNAPPRDYSLEHNKPSRAFSAFTSISILAAIFGNGILPEIQATLAPPAAGKMVKGLGMCYAVVYSQVAYELMEKKSADVNQGVFSKRNVIPRIILRTIYMIICGFVAAMLPFFGDINGVVGAIGFIPLDFVLPMLLYNMTYRPPRSTFTYWINTSIMVVFTGVGIMGAFSSIRKLVLDANQLKKALLQ
ncbi:unnamed protein product [Sphenostylis stenocarpa]|uniref:Amino acid transporter transmembrane domain-containing protein n=1 Tax=Sphenostylis stenocarpa TaxID=92480 RepID=A0AA86S671_9FABA|nr:unnamed protein product [Sphenostylis stenocarpa]